MVLRLVGNRRALMTLALIRQGHEVYFENFSQERDCNLSSLETCRRELKHRVTHSRVPPQLEYDYEVYFEHFNRIRICNLAHYITWRPCFLRRVVG